MYVFLCFPSVMVVFLGVRFHTSWYPEEKSPPTNYEAMQLSMDHCSRKECMTEKRSRELYTRFFHGYTGINVYIIIYAIYSLWLRVLCLQILASLETPFLLGENIKFVSNWGGPTDAGSTWVWALDSTGFPGGGQQSMASLMWNGPLVVSSVDSLWRKLCADRFRSYLKN